VGDRNCLLEISKESDEALNGGRQLRCSPAKLANPMLVQAQGALMDTLHHSEGCNGEIWQTEIDAAHGTL
jgi:hypothetical protein